MTQKVLILGASGMVGHKLFSELSKQSGLTVSATCRSGKKISNFFAPELMSKIIPAIEVSDFSTVEKLLNEHRPDIVINCIGITKQLIKEDDPLSTIEINSVFPHRLARHCHQIGARMIQMATDCVFSGTRGNYSETSSPDATDLYGRTKFLGEVHSPGCLTIRTSFIGHELGRSHGLLEWFLAQKNEARGFTQAIYSGMPTVVIANVISKYVLPNSKLHGLYQISTVPISKYDLLQLIAKVYGKTITINPDASVEINRSLDSTKFQNATGYKPLSWEKMLNLMYQDYKSARYGAKSKKDKDAT